MGKTDARNAVERCNLFIHLFLYPVVGIFICSHPALIMDLFQNGDQSRDATAARSL